MVPPVTAATRVEVPALKVPKDASKDWNVIVEAFAVSVPLAVAATVPATVMGRLAPEVVRIVLPVGLGAVFWTVRLPERVRPRVDRVYVIPEAAVVSKTALANSAPLRFVPAKTMVRATALLNVTVAVPADHEPDVEAFVQEPPTAQDAEPNPM